MHYSKEPEHSQLKIGDTFIDSEGYTQHVDDINEKYSLYCTQIASTKPNHEENCTCQDCAVFNEIAAIGQALEGHQFENPERLTSEPQKSDKCFCSEINDRQLCMYCQFEESQETVHDKNNNEPTDPQKERLLAICEKQMDCIESYKKDWKTVFGHLQKIASVSSKSGKLNMGNLFKIATEALKPDNPLQQAIIEMYEISERNAR